MCGSDCQDVLFAWFLVFIVMGIGLLFMLPTILRFKNQCTTKEIEEIERIVRFKSYNDIDSIKNNTRK